VDGAEDQYIEVAGGDGIKSAYNLTNRVIIPNTADGWVLSGDRLSNSSIITGKYQSPRWSNFDATGTRAGYVIFYDELDEDGNTERLDFGSDASLRITAKFDNFSYNMKLKDLPYYMFSTYGGRQVMVERSPDQILLPINPLTITYSEIGPLHTFPNPTFITRGTERDFSAYSYSYAESIDPLTPSPTISMVTDKADTEITQVLSTNGTAYYGVMYAVSISFDNPTNPDPFTLDNSYFDINPYDSNNPPVIYSSDYTI
jgi:hypothetical protein